MSLKALEKQKRSNREWLLREGTAMMREEDLKYIEQNIESDLPGTRSSIADSLDRLASWYAVTGELALIDGSLDGWTEIHRSWLYASLSLRIQMSVFQRGRVLGQFRPVKSLSLEANTTALCLAYALVADRDFETSVFGEVLRVMLVDRDVVRDDYWEYHHLEPFVFQLLALLKKEDLAVQKDFNRELGPYQTVIDVWNEPSSMGEALHRICDYHCERMEDTDCYFAEFKNPPFDLVPAEVLAVYSVRQRLGLDTLNVEHPLLEPPFNSPIGDPSEIEDPLLDRVEANV